MNIYELSSTAALFFLIFARIFAMLSVVPIFSSQSIPTIARVSLCFLTASLLFPGIRDIEISNFTIGLASNVSIESIGTSYVFLLTGEILIGLIQGFFVYFITSVFQTAGQFFSIQMGFGASAVFDPLAQEEVPLMGQLFNLIALLVFILIDGFQKLFFTGIVLSFQNVRASNFLGLQQSFLGVLVHGLSMLFQQALSMSFPIFGTLFLVSITMGLLAKAAPQMNLLLLGFPLAILVGFVMLFIILPALINAMTAIFDNAFSRLENILINAQESLP